eukprot:363655-Chlamydomonas_euryale.AAC.1
MGLRLRPDERNRAARDSAGTRPVPRRGPPPLGTLAPTCPELWCIHSSAYTPPGSLKAFRYEKNRTTPEQLPAAFTSSGAPAGGVE